MDLYVGTSGYSYKEWCGTFYPDGLPASQMLAHYARQFRTVEINNTFYRMPTERLLAQWSAQVPSDFSFVLKTSRKITHVKRLKGVEEETSYLLHTLSALGDQLGPMLVQLPPNLKKDAAALGAFLRLFPDGWKAAFEFRNRSRHDEEIYDLLRRRGMALVATDETDDSPKLTTGAGWGYARLRRDSYSDSELSAWCARLRQPGWESVHVFFKHEDGAAGPELASRFTTIWRADR